MIRLKDIIRYVFLKFFLKDVVVAPLPLPALHRSSSVECTGVLRLKSVNLLHSKYLPLIYANS